jgi:ubiquinol-cytochrome c reductase cytochrome b subunit
VSGRIFDDRRRLTESLQARDYPVRTAIGAGGFFFLTIMLVAGSNDVIAARFMVSVEAFTNVLRILITLGPLAVGYATYHWCYFLQRRDRAAVEA